MTGSREFYDINAVEHFDDEVKEEILEKLEEIREDILQKYGFYFDYEDVFLPHIDERIINIY